MQLAAPERSCLPRPFVNDKPDTHQRVLDNLLSLLSAQDVIHDDLLVLVLLVVLKEPTIARSVLTNRLFLKPERDMTERCTTIHSMSKPVRHSAHLLISASLWDGSWEMSVKVLYSGSSACTAMICEAFREISASETWLNNDAASCAGFWYQHSLLLQEWQTAIAQADTTSQTHIKTHPMH
jgi:hypothetical protein